MIKIIFTITLLIVMGMQGYEVFAQQESQNTRALKKYFVQKKITILEWELLQFNINWQGSFTYDTTYLSSFPLGFDYHKSRFRTILGVHEKRDAQDPEPFFSLNRPKRESILRGAIDYLINMLGKTFPEVLTQPSLLYVEFKYRSKGGGFTNVAVYENGKLTLYD